MTVTSIFKQALELSKSDRLKLAKKIQASAEDVIDPDLTPAQNRELRRRLDEIEKHPRIGKPISELVKKVEALRRVGK